MAIDFNAKYILNPEYIIRNDGNRIILANKKEANHSYCTFIHPLWAIVLSHFDGKQNLNETIKAIATVTGIPEQKIIPKITPFIENAQHFCMEYDHLNFWYPPQIIVKNDKEEKREDIDRESLFIEPPYDFKTLRLNIPLSVMLVLNTTCVTNCIYCYADKVTHHSQMSLDKVLDLIDEAHASGIKGFDLSGGEIFTFKGWEHILKKIYEKGYNPYLSTKVPLSRQEIDQLYATGARKIQISLDSLNPQLLKETLKVPLDYCDKIKETIINLNKKGFAITVKSVLTRSTCTVENLSELIEFIKSVPGIQQYTYTPVGYSHYKSVEDFNAFKPTMEQIIDMDEYFEHLQQTKLHFSLFRDTGAVSDGAECRNAQIFNNRAVCSGNVYNMVILPDGQVTICEELYWNPNFIIGNVTENSLLEVWCSSKAMALWKLAPKRIPAESACHACDDFEACRYKEGVCWKELIAAYGKENWLYPDTRCPKAPKPIRPVFYDNSFIEE